MVIDPEVPEAAKGELRSMPQAFLLSFAAQAPTASPRFRRPRAADAYHRRYVVPELDLDDDAKHAWERAATAVAAIRRSQVVAHNFIDSVQVNTILPYVEWEIAERLARVSMVRDRQRAALGGVDDGIRREQAVRQLAQLSDSHLDMVAGLAPSGNEEAITQQASTLPGDQ